MSPMHLPTIPRLRASQVAVLQPCRFRVLRDQIACKPCKSTLALCQPDEAFGLRDVQFHDP